MDTQDPGGMRISVRKQYAAKHVVVQRRTSYATATCVWLITDFPRISNSPYTRRSSAAPFDRACLAWPEARGLKPVDSHQRGDWRNGIFGRCVTAAGRTGQLRHRGERFAVQFGLELAFADRSAWVRC